MNTDLTAWVAKTGPIMRAALGLKIDRLRPEGDIKSNSVATDLDWNLAKIGFLQFRDRFEALVYAVESVCESRGVQIMIWDAQRSLERQAALYQRGRYGDTGAKVTWTMGSNHLVGCAVDYCVRDAKGNPSFVLPKFWINDVLPLAKPCGLESLYLRVGKDKPHFEVPAKDLSLPARAWLAKIKQEAPV